MLYKDIKFFNGSPVETIKNESPVITGATFGLKEKGYALETSNGKYAQYPSQLLPNGAFSVVVWAKLRNSHVIGSDEAEILGAVNISGANSIVFSHGGGGYPLLWLSSTNYTYFNYIPNKRWHCFIFTIPGSAQNDINNSQFFVDGVSCSLISQVSSGQQSSRSAFVYAGGGNSITSGFHISRIKVYDEVISANQILQEQDEFNNFKLAQKPKRGFAGNPKPTDLSQFKGTGINQGLVAAYNMSPKGNVLVDISGNGNNGVISGNVHNTKNGLSFNNSTGTATISSSTNPLNNDFTFSVRFKLRSAANPGRLFQSQYIFIYPQGVSGEIWVTRDAGTTYSKAGNNLQSLQNKWITISILSTNNGTTNFYFDGLLQGTINQSAGTPLSSVGSWTIGNRSDLVRQFDGEIQDIRIHNRLLTPAEIRQYHNQFDTPYLLEDFSTLPIDGSNVLPQGMIAGTGLFKGNILLNDVVSGGLRLPKNKRFLQCTQAGTISFPSQWVSGSVEIDWYKGINTTSKIIVINSSYREYPNTVNSYEIDLGPTKNIAIYKANATTYSSLIVSAISYFQENTWYTTRIECTPAGQFTLLIKGGLFVPTAGRNGWTLVSTTGGSGTNPVVDATYNSSSYGVLSCGVGDCVAGIRYMDGIKQI